MIQYMESIRLTYKMPKILRGEKKVDKKELKKERKAQKKAFKKARRKF